MDSKSVFFENSFLETFPLTFAAFQSSICLRFLFGGFFATKSDLGVRGFSGGFFVPKMPILRPENGDEKSSPFLSLGFRSSIFATARFSRVFCATNSVFCRGGVFVGFGCACFCDQTESSEHPSSCKRAGWTKKEAAQPMQVDQKVLTEGVPMRAVHPSLRLENRIQRCLTLPTRGARNLNQRQNLRMIL